MPLYEVLVERYIQATIWIDAADPEEARTGAIELSDALPEGDWEHGNTGAAVMPRAALAPHVDEVWVGGEAGSWVHGDDYDKGVRS